jgi:hypothetical protein
MPENAHTTVGNQAVRAGNAMVFVSRSIINSHLGATIHLVMHLLPKAWAVKRLRPRVMTWPAPVNYQVRLRR